MAGRTRTILLAIICLLLFVAGIFVGNMTVTTVTKTMTLTTTLREEVTIHTTVTAELPLLVISRAELRPICIYNNTLSGPEEDPNCTKNTKALALILVVKNVGKVPVKVCPASMFVHAFGMDPSPYYIEPTANDITLEPGSYSMEITGIYIPRDLESLIRYYYDAGGLNVRIAYGVEGENCTEIATDKATIISGVWWPGAGS